MSIKLFETTMKKVEKLIIEKMAAVRSPGLALTYLKDGKVIYQRCFGTKNRENDFPVSDPVTPDTSFEIGSCTKSFTCLAIMQLQEKGKLKIHDPVKKYLDWFELGSDDDPITIHHLMSHSSGIPSLCSAGVTISRITDPDKDVPLIPISTKEDYYSFINNAASQIKYKPGEKYFYCNDGYNLLGKIIEAVSGKSFEDYIREYILAPIGMDKSFFGTEAPPEDGDVAVHYMIKNGQLIPARRTINALNNPAGGLICSSNDIVKYMNMVMNGGILGNTRILSQESIEAQTTIYTPDDSMVGKLLPTTGDSGYAYGWLVSKGFYGYSMVQHSGGTGVCLTNIITIPDLNIGVFGTTNTSNEFSMFYHAGLLALMGKNYEEELPLIKAMEHEKLLAGEYQSYCGLNKLTVTSSEMRLLANMSNLDMPFGIPLIPDEQDLTNMRYFVYTGPGIKMIIQFTKQENGDIFATAERNLWHKVK